MVRGMTTRERERELKLLRRWSFLGHGFSKSFRMLWAEKPYHERILLLKELVEEGEQVLAFERRYKTKKVS